MKRFKSSLQKNNESFFVISDVVWKNTDKTKAIKKETNHAMVLGKFSLN